MKVATCLFYKWEICFPHLLLQNKILISNYEIISLFAFTASSESEGKDGYDSSTQFDEVPLTESDNYDEDSVNIDLELAIEASLHKPAPHGQTKTQAKVLCNSNEEN